MVDAFTYLKTNNNNKVRTNCLIGLDSSKSALKDELSSENYKKYENAFTNIFDATALSDFDRAVDMAKKIISFLDNEEAKFEIVFLPYNSSMWDSMESIYLAAKDDIMCNAVVIPIPYFDRNDNGEFGKMHYEGNQFPDYVPITDYREYDFQIKRPDVIYIHNPFDQYNIVTSVHPFFYSKNLRNFTDMLVYVPYFICGSYSNLEAFASKHCNEALNNINYFIAQSKYHGELLEKIGYPKNRIKALGSPKIDKIVNTIDYDIPQSWKKKIGNKKVVILNSSIGSLLSEEKYLEKLENRIESIIAFKEIILIWRPHPLLEATINSMRTVFKDKYSLIMHKCKNSDRIIVDNLPDTMASTYISDGMISDISSWMRQYVATGKPILMLNGKSNFRDTYLCVFDHFSNYFIRDGFTIEKFCEDVILNNNDTKKAERKKYLESSVNDLSGNVGRNIHLNIIAEINK